MYNNKMVDASKKIRTYDAHDRRSLNIEISQSLNSLVLLLVSFLLLNECLDLELYPIPNQTKSRYRLEACHCAALPPILTLNPREKIKRYSGIAGRRHN